MIREDTTNIWLKIPIYSNKEYFSYAHLDVWEPRNMKPNDGFYYFVNFTNNYLKKTKFIKPKFQVVEKKLKSNKE